MITKGVFSLFALGQLAAAEFHHHGRHEHSCETVTHFETVTLAASTLASSSELPVPIAETATSVPVESISYETVWVTSTVGPLETISTSIAEATSKTSSSSSFTSSAFVTTTRPADAPQTITSSAVQSETSTSSVNSASETLDSLYAAATAINVGVQATIQCGDDGRLDLPGMDWTVGNSMYNAYAMKDTDSQCTNFKQVLHDGDEKANGTYLIEWNSQTNIAKDDSTKSICKGYSNIGLAKGLNTKFSDVASIPTYYKFSRGNTEGFQGSALYDFVFGPETKMYEGTQTREFMLFIKNWGNQIPLGYDDGAIDTVELFGKSWKIYAGKNPQGVLVHTLFPDTYYEGEFSGDLREWLDSMANKGYITPDWYLNVGNAGVEVFYGQSEMNATVALDIQT